MTNFGIVFLVILLVITAGMGLRLLHLCDFDKAFISFLELLKVLVVTKPDEDKKPPTR